jgi:hypothetical protein
MTTEALKSLAITNLDSVPVVQNTTGEGAPAYAREVDGYISPVQLTVGSTYQLVRIPSNAKIKSVVLATDKALDSNGSNTLVFDLNLAVSDSTMDNSNAAQLGQIPTTANTGTTTTVAAYASPNIIFGQISASAQGHTAAYPPTELIFNGTNYDMTKLTNTPLWTIFGYSVDPGGFFDLMAYVSTAAATAVTTGTIFARVLFAD